VGRTAGKEIGCHVRSHFSTGWSCNGPLLFALLCTACILLFATEVRAQCAAHDGLQSQVKLKKIASTSAPQIMVRSADDVPVWKTIAIGTFPDSFALIGALDAARCAIGGMAGEILARPAFGVSSTKTNVELFAVSAADLGFKTGTVTLANVYARAQQLGFGLTPAEIAPQLRLQYIDQPMGEFLIIGMEPIKTWEGEPVILNVANGGAGLILIGQDGRADAEISVISRFVFVRPNKGVPADGLDQAAALALQPP
jgi:hypothetical protein